MAEEAKIEGKCRRAVEAMGGRMPKWTSAGSRGVPDRILLLRGLPAVFVEFKAPGKKPTPQQMRWHEWLRDQGHRTWVIDSYSDFLEKLDAFVAGSE